MTDRKWKTQKIAQLLGHENFKLTDSRSEQTPNDDWVIFVGFIDNTVNAWAEARIDLATGKTEIVNS
jgi:hypothetical protein